jgi:hypothetical protein
MLIGGELLGLLTLLERGADGGVHQHHAVGGQRVVSQADFGDLNLLQRHFVTPKYARCKSA